MKKELSVWDGAGFREQEVPNTQGREVLGDDIFPEQRYEFQARIRPPVEAGSIPWNWGLSTNF
jgi:hypothetical protein